MKKLFVIMPFGIKHHDNRDIDFDSIYEALIKPIERLTDWTVYRIDEFVSTGLITNQYLEELLEADMVLAEISTPNANVYYELGIRQTISPRGTILIAQSETKLPFDISTQRVIFYENTSNGIKDAESKIIEALNASSVSSSPVNDFFTNYRKGILNEKNKNEIELEFKHQLSIADSLGEHMVIWDWVKESQNVQENQLFELSKQFINRQRWNLAEEVLKKAFKQNPKDILISKELGWVISKKGNEFNNEALNYLQNALEIDSKNSEILGIIGGIYKSDGNLKEAVKYYSLGAKYSPNDNYMLITQAALEILLNPNLPDQGISSYERLKKKILTDENYEFDIWSLVNLAEANYVTDNLEEAFTVFEKVFANFEDIKPIISTAKQISELGRVGFKSKESQQIIQYLKRSLTEYEKQFEDLQETKIIEEEKVDTLPLIVHISDLHFGTKVNGEPMHRFIPTPDDRRDLSKHLVEEIKLKYSTKLTNIILIASGDFVYLANEAEFQQALDSLNEICVELNIPKKRVVIVPGNHDINWIKDAGGPGKRFEDYLIFIYNFYGEELFNELYPFLSDDDLKITGPPVKPENIISFHQLDSLITIIGMNSCIYENKQHHYGFIGWQQFKNVKNKINKISPDQKNIRIAVLHHQMHPFPEPLGLLKDEEKWIDLSVIRDGGYVERNLQDLDFDLVFHGHKHHPQIRETKVSVKKENFDKRHSLLVFGAGSIGVNQSERGIIPNHFQTIEFLSFPRTTSVDFVKVVWHELEDEVGADWQSQNRWTISG